MKPPKLIKRALSIPTVRVSSRPLLPPMSHTIEISITVSDLVGLEHLARVACVLSHNDTESEKNWRHLGTTNPTVVFSRSADFEDKIPYKYVFEKAQLIKIDICRLHDGETASGSDDVVASCIFKVDELIGSFGLQLRRSLLFFFLIFHCHGKHIEAVLHRRKPIFQVFERKRMEDWREG
ncbi:hypothetical protein NECAME_16700 [Necator americanus]|uniref:Uncharacterized protein n=1 Tax=Necator americanus TaxID=51031 RepID=W2TX55_NECAM|nr:hypothetical protein NECAME_16700 [Necator americanus]ETN85651.1 hypothetical protein NECAME_16700 [Necator americanus]